MNMQAFQRAVEKAQRYRCTYPPVAVTADVLKFCERFGDGRERPLFVSVRPESSTLNECVAILQDKVARDGGEAVNGWAIWEWPTIVLEAEFHVVWKSPAGELMDGSPKQDGETRILFLPDGMVEWKRLRIPNKRMPLRNIKPVSEFIAAGKMKYLLLGPTTGAYRVTPEIARNEMRLAQAIIHCQSCTPAELVSKAREAAGITAPAVTL